MFRGLGIFLLSSSLGMGMPVLGLAVEASLLTQSPSVADALSLAQILSNDGNSTQAETHARKILSQFTATFEQRAAAIDVIVRALIAREAYVEAIKLLDEHATLVQTITPVLFRAQRIYTLYQLGRYEEVKQIEVPISDKLDVWSVLALHYRAKAYLKLDQSDDAMVTYKIINDGTLPSLRYKNALDWARALADDGRYETALELIEPFIQQPDTTPDVQISTSLGQVALVLYKSELCEKLSRLDEAVESVVALSGNAFLTSSERLSVFETLALLYDRRGQAEQALIAVRQAYELADEVSAEEKDQVGQLLAQYLLRTPETFTEGTTLLQEIIRRNPSSDYAPLLQLSLAEAFLSAGHPQDALTEYTRYMQAYDIPALRMRVLAGRARVLQALKRDDEAAAAFDEAVKLAPDKSDVQLALRMEQAAATYRAKRYPQAIVLYRALLTEPKLAQRNHHLAMLADAYETQGDAKEAILVYKQLMTDASDSVYAVTAMSRLAGIAADEGSHKEAIDLYGKLIVGDYADAVKEKAMLDRGRVYYKTFNLNLASSDFKDVLESKDIAICEEAQFFLVLSLYRLGRDDEARAAADLYKNAYPDSEKLPDVVLWLAKSDFNQGHYEQARKTFLSFVKQWPTHDRADVASLWAARASLNLQDYPDSIATISHMVKAYPKSEWIVEARYIQAEALVEQARFTEALAVLDAVITLAPTGGWAAEAWALKADCLYTTAAGRPNGYQDAIVAYREAIARLDLKRGGSAMQYRYKIGRALEKQKLYDQAIDYYHEFVVLQFLKDRDAGLWQDSNNTQWMMKALYQLSELLRKSGNRERGLAILQRVVNTQTLGTEDAKIWLKRLEKE